MKSCGIYKIQNLQNGKVYIGKSLYIERRIRHHKRALRANDHCNQHLQHAWNKYGEDAFEFAIVELCQADDLNDREIFWIEHYDAFKSGYNCNLGGDGNHGYVMSEESKRKMIANLPDVSGENNPMYGKNIKDYMTPEAYDAWLLARKHCGRAPGWHWSEADKRNLSRKKKEYYLTHVSPLKGLPRVKEHAEAARDGLVDYYKTNRSHSCVPVVCLNTGVIYMSYKEAALANQIQQTSISQCCSGKYLSAGQSENGEKLVWMPLSEYHNVTQDYVDAMVYQANVRMHRGAHPLAKRVVCINTGEVFDCAADAAHAFHVDCSSLVKVCKGKLKSCGKDAAGTPLGWRYLDQAS